MLIWIAVAVGAAIAAAAVLKHKKRENYDLDFKDLYKEEEIDELYNRREQGLTRTRERDINIEENEIEGIERAIQTRGSAGPEFFEPLIKEVKKEERETEKEYKLSREEVKRLNKEIAILTQNARKLIKKHEKTSAEGFIIEAELKKRQLQEEDALHERTAKDLELAERELKELVKGRHEGGFAEARGEYIKKLMLERKEELATERLLMQLAEKFNKKTEKEIKQLYNNIKQGEIS